MRLHRFFGNFDFSKESFSVSDKNLVAQWLGVLRFGVGSELILCDGKLNEGLARIVAFKKNSVEVEIIGTSQNENEPVHSVTLYLAVLKGEHVELAVEKAVELGVSKIVPVVSGRTIKQNIRIDRLQKIIREAAEQSGRGVVPELSEPTPFLSATRLAGKNDANFFFDSAGEDIRRYATSEKKKGNSFGIFIGPEGGWTEQEIDLAKRSKFHIASIGKLTLRSETAAVVATYIIVNL